MSRRELSDKEYVIMLDPAEVVIYPGRQMSLLVGCNENTLVGVDQIKTSTGNILKRQKGIFASGEVYSKHYSTVGKAYSDTLTHFDTRPEKFRHKSDVRTIFIPINGKKRHPLANTIHYKMQSDVILEN